MLYFSLDSLLATSAFALSCISWRIFSGSLLKSTSKDILVMANGRGLCVRDKEEESKEHYSTWQVLFDHTGVNLYVILDNSLQKGTSEIRDFPVIQFLHTGLCR